MGFKKIKFKFVEFLLRGTWNKNMKKNAKVPPGTKTSLFMNPTAYLTPRETIFQISNQSVKSFDLEVSEHRDIESKNYYIDFNLFINDFHPKKC